MKFEVLWRVGFADIRLVRDSINRPPASGENVSLFVTRHDSFRTQRQAEMR